MKLNELGHKYGTDKDSSYHNYLEIYEELFRDVGMKDLLEIGVASGASLRMWKEYFPLAEIRGIDNDIRNQFIEPRIHVFHIDQSDEKALDNFVWVNGMHDIIIDDGSHYPEDQIFTAKKLLPTVRGGGLYVIEDVESKNIVRICKELEKYKPEWLPSSPKVKTEKDDNHLIIIRKI